ncbi:MAG: hypothetical protein ABIY55_01610 [Kofleriaceae bacterium]
MVSADPDLAPDGVVRTALRSHAELAKLKVRHAFVILDCCFAGAFRWAHVRDIGGDTEKVYRERYDR